MKRVLYILLFISAHGYSQVNYGVKIHGSNSDSVRQSITGSNLQSYITAYVGNILQLPAGTLIITSNIIVPSNIKIIGAGIGNTIIQLSGSATIGFSLTGSTNVTISNLTIKGTYTSPVITDTTTINSLSDLRTLKGIGTQSGIYITGGTQKVILNNINFENLSKAGLFIENTAEVIFYNGQLSATNLNSIGCYSGYYLRGSASYETLTNLKSNGCLVGMISFTGNLYVSNSQFNYNRVAFFGGHDYSGGYADSHSSISNTSFNHSAFYNIAIDSTSQGFFLTGCEIFSGTMVINASTGFCFTGGRFEGTATITDGGTNLVANSFWLNNVITLIGTGSLKRLGNYLIGTGAAITNVP